MSVLPKGMTIYHSTIHDFDPNEIKTPCWFSVIEEQSHLHLCFKHYGHPCGKLLTYKLRENVKVLDLSEDGYLRMFVNANGNYRLAELMKDSDMYGGYKNYKDQAEIMLVDNAVLEFVGEKEIDLNKRVRYVEKSEGWRMVDKECDSDSDRDKTSCCMPSRKNKPPRKNKKINIVVPI